MKTRTGKTKDRIAPGWFCIKKISWGSRVNRSKFIVNKSKLPERYRKVEGPPRPPGPFKIKDVFKLALMAIINNAKNRK
jgi:hypothetical protein